MQLIVERNPESPHVQRMRPNAREAKYDRQLRLWAANGQFALENATICLLNATTTGSEILKNLVLPGVGRLVIVDDKKVDGAEAGTNFFLDEDCIGQNRAERILGNLLELNPDVEGWSINENPINIISRNDGFFTDFDLIIACDMQEKNLLQLADTLWKANIPLLVVKCVGFIGQFRIAVPEHTIVETHPDSLVDLRLDCPWPELKHLAETVNLDEMEEMEHEHVPCVLLLLKYMQEWKDAHGGRAPANFDEKSKFKRLLKSGMRHEEEENFQEAINAVWRACTVTTLPKEVVEIFADAKCENLGQKSEPFWLLARSVMDFVATDGEGLLPVSGVLPDMKADSARYVLLQNLYRKKAKADISFVTARVREHMTRISYPSPISDGEINNFCRQARFIRVIRYRTLADEYAQPNSKAISSGLHDADDLVHHYLAFRAYDRFIERYGHPPGRAATEEIGKDIEDMKSIALDVGQRFGAEVLSESCENSIHELVRAGGGELHNIAAIMGGIVAQEIIKIITKQYVPANNTCIFDGVTSRSQSWEL